MRDSEHKHPAPPEQPTRSWGRAADVAGTISGSVIGCLLAGYLIGEYFDSKPAAVITGLFVGIVVGLYNLAKAMRIGR